MLSIELKLKKLSLREKEKIEKKNKRLNDLDKNEDKNERNNFQSN